MDGDQKCPHPLLAQTGWTEAELHEIMEKRCGKELDVLTAAQFLVLKDLSSSYSELNEIIKTLIKDFKISQWSNINKIATKHASREDYGFCVIERSPDHPAVIGPCCVKFGIDLNDLYETRYRNVQVTVELFLELSKLKLNGSFTWDDLVGWISNISPLSMSRLDAIKLYTKLNKLKKELSKNKKKEKLKELCETNIVEYLRKEENASLEISVNEVSKDNQIQILKKNREKLRAEISQMKEKEVEMKEIIKEQSKELAIKERKKKDAKTKEKQLQRYTNTLKKIEDENRDLRRKNKSLIENVKLSKKENYYKRLKRRERKLEELEAQMLKDSKEKDESEMKFQKLKKVQQKMKAQNKRSLNKVDYFRRKSETYKSELEKTQGNMKIATKIQNDMAKEIENLECKLQDNVKIVDTLDGKSYNDDVRTCVLQLQSLDLPCNKIGPIIKTVSENVFHADVKKVPSRSTIQNILDEGQYLSRQQLGSTIKEVQNWDLFTDCTSRDGRKILDAGVHLSDGRTMSLGFTTIAREDAETVKQTIQSILSETVDTIVENEDDGDRSGTLSKMLSTLSCLLSDRSSVMKKYNTLFSEWRNEMIRENLPDIEVPNLHFIYCSAHVLLGFHSAIDNALKHQSQDKRFPVNESSAVNTIRLACELFGPRGDEKNGRRGDWLAYTRMINKETKIPSYRANRFNNLFTGALAVMFHLNDMKTFIEEYLENPNSKIQAVLAGLQCETTVLQIRAIAIVASVITGPFWTLVNDTTVNHFDLHQYFGPLQSSLDRWKTDATELLSNNTSPVFTQYPHEMVDDLYEDTDKCKSMLQKICESLLSVVKRQLADHLEAGCAKDLSTEQRSRTAHSKSTNLSAEHLFGDLDNGICRKRNATLRHHTGTIMLKRNQTVKWLNEKQKRNRAALIAQARKMGRKLRKNEKEKEKKVKERRREILQAVKATKERKRNKIEEEKEKLRMKVGESGGVCTSRRDIARLLKKQNTLTLKLQALKTQIMFHKKVKKTNVSDKTLFVLSNKGKACSLFELKQKLMGIIGTVSES